MTHFPSDHWKEKGVLHVLSLLLGESARLGRGLRGRQAMYTGSASTLTDPVFAPVRARPGAFARAGPVTESARACSQ